MSPLQYSVALNRGTWFHTNAQAAQTSEPAAFLSEAFAARTAELKAVFESLRILPAAASSILTRERADFETASAWFTAAMAFLCFFAALSLIVPLINRKRNTGSYAPPVSDPYEPVQGAPQHFVIATVLVIAILLVMRYGLAPNIATIPLTVGIAFFAVMALLGAPLFSFLGGMGLFLFVKFFLMDPDVSRHANAFGNSVEDILGNHFARMSVLATIPLFTLAGYIMSESRMPQRLVRVSRALLGWMPGGLAVVCVFASAFFTIFSGASGITIVAVGGLLVPALLRDKYPENFSLGLVTARGAHGITVAALPSGDIDITIRGPWLHTILFEIPVLAIVNEVYFRNTHKLPDLVEGRRRLDVKISQFREEGLGDIKIADYGTRRRFSQAWHEEVLRVLSVRLGTSQSPGSVRR